METAPSNQRPRMRSWLVVPADRPGHLEEALHSGADVLVLDLGLAVVSDVSKARRAALCFLRSAREKVEVPALYVRVNTGDAAISAGDLDAVITAAPDGIFLPAGPSGADVALLDSRLAVREALHGLPDGSTRIVSTAPVVATLAANRLYFFPSSRRLNGLVWDAEGTASLIGASTARMGDTCSESLNVARSLCLFAAAAAQVIAIDAISAVGDPDSLRRDCERALRDGFSAKLASGPEQVQVINEIFV